MHLVVGCYASDSMATDGRFTRIRVGDVHSGVPVHRHVVGSHERRRRRCDHEHARDRRQWPRTNFTAICSALALTEHDESPILAVVGRACDRVARTIPLRRRRRARHIVCAEGNEQYGPSISGRELEQRPVLPRRPATDGASSCREGKSRYSGTGDRGMTRTVAAFRTPRQDQRAMGGVRLGN